MAVLEGSELEAEVAKLPGWEVRSGALEKSFQRGDFNGSMALLNRIAEAADAADHHPDVLISWDTSVTSTSMILGPSVEATSKRAPSKPTVSPTFGARPSSPKMNPPTVW
jgi:4a-hydroxytetrahydrobiopterin dehydratase